MNGRNENVKHARQHYVRNLCARWKSLVCGSSRSARMYAGAFTGSLGILGGIVASRQTEAAREEIDALSRVARAAMLTSPNGGDIITISPAPLNYSAYSAFVGPRPALQNIYAPALNCEYCGSDPGSKRHCQNCGAPKPTRTAAEYGYRDELPSSISSQTLLLASAAAALFMLRTRR
jgi:hypothetical protein